MFLRREEIMFPNENTEPLHSQELENIYFTVSFLRVLGIPSELQNS